MASGESDAPARAGMYQVEVDSERHHFHEDVPFSFWGSAKVILLLSVLLWWLPQSAGYMVAGYVGGRRAGSPWRAVIASLIPVIIIFGVSAAYDNGYARPQIDFLAGLPASVANAVGGAIPFLQPYTEFVVQYLTTFVLALQTLFGMGTNGYMVTVAFAYIGGIVADQTRREIGAKSGGSGSASVRIVQPIVERLHLGGHEDAGPRPVVEARPLAVAQATRRARGRPSSLSEYRKIPAQADPRHLGRAAPRRSEEDEAREEAAAARIAEPEPRPVHHRTKDEAAEMQRFVERALRNYDRSRHSPHHRE